MLQNIRYLVVADNIPSIGEIHDIYETIEEAQDACNRYKKLSNRVEVYETSCIIYYAKN